MRPLVLLFALLLSLVPQTVLGEVFDTPAAALQALYAPLLRDQIPDDYASFFSEALNALYAADAEATPEGEMGALGFDPVINGQDFALSNLVIEDATPDGDQALVAVTFDNFDEPQTLFYHMVLEDDGWLVDDIESVTPGLEWQLSDIFLDAGY